ncbi:MAG: hypothetical protein K2M43_01050 [Mycoplasmoidaceae bacterium]|nr:hypothetical protein [Mycoplasmoidaceae bacterium]
MKRSIKTNLIGLVSLGATLVLPMAALTSCSGITQYYLPVLVNAGGAFANSDAATDQNGYRINYLPASYDYAPVPQSSTGVSSTAYSYCAPHNHDTDDTHKQLDPITVLSDDNV